MEIGDLPGGALRAMQQALAEVEAVDLDEPIVGPVDLGDAMEPSNLDLLTFLDLEASGLGNGCFPIEVGWVHADGRGDSVLVGVERWLCGGGEWDYSAEELHGLSKDYLLEHGMDARPAAFNVMVALGGRIVIADSPMDQRWLHELLAEAEWPHPWPQVLDMARLLINATGSPNALADYLERAHQLAPPCHRAEPDARFLWTAWELCLQDIGRERCAAALDMLIAEDRLRQEVNIGLADAQAGRISRKTVGDIADEVRREAEGEKDVGDA